MPSIAALAPIALVLTNTPFDADPRVATPAAGPLAIASLLALATALAAGFGGEVFLVQAERVLEVDGGGGGDGALAGLGREGGGRHGEFGDGGVVGHGGRLVVFGLRHGGAGGVAWLGGGVLGFGGVRLAHAAGLAVEVVEGGVATVFIVVAACDVA